jgi:carbonic anhydrase
MKRYIWLVAVIAAYTVLPARAAEPPATSVAEKERIRLIVKEVLREYAAEINNKPGHSGATEVVRDIRQANQNFMRGHGPAYFKPFLDSQHPRATVITCSDSRVHTQALDATPDNDLFVIRDIGNQLVTAEGSVEYGVHHLHTPLLLIVGHSACGAIKAAASDYSGESPAIRAELDTIQIPKGDPGIGSVQLNVNNQVRRAMSKFEAEVMSGHLTVVGAVYDFRNDMKLGQGRLDIINVNGETDPAKLALLEMMSDPPGHSPPMRHRSARKRAPRQAEPEAESAPSGKETAAESDKPAKKAKADH